MTTTPLTEILFRSRSDAETHRLGAAISLIVRTGDMLALSGDLGAGKSTFARGLIRHALDDEKQEISSPTYTLCNVYATTPGIAHFDLYRLGSPDELEELGLEDALEAGMAIIEWPENGFDALPPNAVLVKITEEKDQARTFHFSGNADFLQRIERSLAIENLLAANAMEGLTRRPLAGDASARRYEKLCAKDGEVPFLLMDAPTAPDGPPVRDGKPYSQIAHIAEDVTAFVAIAQILKDAGFAAPEIPAMDLEAGFLVVENLGGELIINEDRKPIAERYLAAIELLAHMHEQEFPDHTALPGGTRYDIPAYDHDAMAIEVELLLEWYLPGRKGASLSKAEKSEFHTIWDELIRIVHAQEQTLVLRDYHSPNIIWRPQYSGISRIGLIDFQDAVIGPTAYDVASLAQDARVDVSEKLETELVERYINCRKPAESQFDEAGFRMAYAIMAAQRATKVLGIFERLNTRDGKPGYLAHIPRLEAYLKRSLKHSVLESYGRWLKTVIGL